MLTQEQVETIKQRLIQQIEATFPEDRKQFAREQIESMDAEQLEKFLIKNNLIRTEGGTGKENCVFCSIISGNIRSYKIAENASALAVLEINPLTKGHVIIIPKDHISSESEMPKEAHSLGKKVSSLIKSRLKPKVIRTESSNVLGHEILNVIPVYDEMVIEETERKHLTPEELSDLQETLKKPVQKTKGRRERKPGIRKIIKKVEEFEEKLWLPKRIP